MNTIMLNRHLIPVEEKLNELGYRNCDNTCFTNHHNILETVCVARLVCDVFFSQVLGCKARHA